jgi:hypothetical protein
MSMIPSNLADAQRLFAELVPRAEAAHAVLAGLLDEAETLLAMFVDQLPADVDPDWIGDLLALAGYDAALAAIEGGAPLDAVS